MTWMSSIPAGGGGIVSRPASCAFGRAVNDPVVSIIMPAYNAAAFLPDTVRSVLAQTFDRFELIIADDGSTDRTLEVARTWEKLDPRVRVFTGPNRGTAAARNAAMGQARGSFFALLDSDDLWDPQFLAIQLAVFERFPEAAIVTGNARSLGGPLDGVPLKRVEGACRRLSLLEMIENENAVCIMSVIRRSVVEQIGGFAEDMRYSEDYEFWVRAAHAGAVFVTNPAPLAFYRRHAASKSADDIAAIGGVIRFLHRARLICHDRPAECAAIDRQLARFEREQLLASAKAHLLRGEFDAATTNLEKLSVLADDLRSGLVARISRHVPHALLWAYRAKSALRSLRHTPLRG